MAVLAGLEPGCWWGVCRVTTRRSQRRGQLSRHSYFSGLADTEERSENCNNIALTHYFQSALSLLLLLLADLTSSHNLHCLPAWCHSVTSHHLSAHNNQRMFDSATHEFLKFFYQLKILRFKYVGHQGTRDHVRGVKQILIIQILRLRGDACRGRERVSSDVISNYVRQPQLQT